jgi:hypothetical protein
MIIHIPPGEKHARIIPNAKVNKLYVTLHCITFESWTLRVAFLKLYDVYNGEELKESLDADAHYNSSRIHSSAFQRYML